jgi:feruloyl esterase
MTDPKNMQLMYEADSKLRSILNSTDPDIGSFKSVGGKLIMYHGWADSFISPRNSIAYYESVRALQGGEKPTQDFLRLFMAPAMGHCGGGNGPNAFDALTVLENWVEKGQAPSSIAASHAGADRKVDRTRPLCVYPEVELYKGSGDINDAANFSCGNPK